MGWCWLYVGAGIMLLELVSPGFVIFFFGLAAATVGLLRFGFGEAFDMTWQFSAFSALSILYLVFLRRFLKTVFMGKVEREKNSMDDDMAGILGEVREEINPPSPGRVMVRDAQWTAKAAGFIAAGEKVRVVSRENLTLVVERI